MPGAGTKMALTANRSVPVLLDITRLTSRVGHGPWTGIDRVEAAYFEWCLHTEPVFFCLARVAGGFVLLDRGGAAEFWARLIGEKPWGARDLRASIGIKTPKPRGRAEADLRRLAIVHSKKDQLSEIGAYFGSQQLTYLNTGHSNLSESVLATLKSHGLPIAVFVHDLIPLEFPEYQRPGTVERFEEKIRVVAQFGAVVITNSKDTEKGVRARFGRHDPTPRIVSAHLGVDVPNVAESADSRNDRPYFVTLGTIEPRKNHRLLLDVWDDLASEVDGPDMPELHIVGRRGWNNEEVFARLDALPKDGPIFEHSNLPDIELWSMLKGARGLLFPSFAEGFGLPSLEAAAFGVPIVCGDLAIHRELLGNYPVYADLNDPYLWKKIIVELTRSRQERSNTQARPPIPTWAAHFERVNETLKGLV